ncbi:MAG: PorV/PorQ family protein [Melioribacteraceae bacterium]|nr:PorV/PorQ family protein [Melioribacteraceae bacterium]MCF8263196.1 PorV/PorQ family protein [Melioribacteraceae bacterium]MCF8431286.1 PorV/PorQ family protein [Melioribacteraceae bacterium]
MKISKIILMMLFICSLSLAQETRKIGTSAANFLRIPVGARASAMGNAFVSMGEDVSGLYWNPAIVSRLSNTNILVDYANWLVGIKHSFVGVTTNLGDLGTIGVSVLALQSPQMDVTTPRNPMGTGETFEVTSMALGLTYSKMLTTNFSIGGTFKYINETIYNSSAAGIAFDVGTFYLTPLAGIRLGASISNFGTKMQIMGDDLNVRVDIAPDQEGNNQSIVGMIKTDKFDMPLIMRIGLSGEIFQTNSTRITIAVDGVNPNDNAQSIDIGSEISFLNELVLLRIGYSDIFLPEREKGLTAGVGLYKLQLIPTLLISVDFSYQQMKYLGSVNRFSIILQL